MCRHKGYTPDKVVHIERWDVVEEERGDDEDYHATAYMQPALTAGLPLIMQNEHGQPLSVDAFRGCCRFGSTTFKQQKAKQPIWSISARKRSMNPGCMHH
jgi:hypothetical protein